MKAGTHIFKIIVFLLIFTSCSTKKKSWVHRSYHNTTAKYNGYFNGKESLKKGVKKIHARQLDDYNSKLSVFPEQNLKTNKQSHSLMDNAIKKASLVIQRHSIKIKGNEYCRWIDDSYLLLGKSYFYKGELEEAKKTFSFIIEEYKDEKIIFEASLWLIRSLSELEEFTSAKMLLNEINKKNKISKSQKKLLHLVSADLNLKMKNNPYAAKSLFEYINLTKNKRKKVRQNYILAQIYQQEKNLKLSKKYFKKVLRSNPNYEMAFNAKMNLARSLTYGDSDQEKTFRELQKIIKDEKNRDYLDRIYYTLALMDMNKKDTVSAIKNYTLSCVNSINNNSQKALSFLELAKIFFHQEKYSQAKTYYDSTVFYMKTDFRLFEETKEQSETTTEIVYHKSNVYMQDSLQILAKLPLDQQKNIVNQIISKKKEQERIKAALESQNRQNTYTNRSNQDQFSQNTSGGKWYFYNPAALSFGFSEFRKKWGKRKLEDNWRRKNKEKIIETQNDTTNSDTLQFFNEPNTASNYIDKIPNTKEKLILSDIKIKESLYQLGRLYSDELKKPQKSNQTYMSIVTRYPNDNKHSPLALYSIYVNCITYNDSIYKQKIKDQIIREYPSSLYASLVKNKNNVVEANDSIQIGETAYNKVYTLYNTSQFDSVIEATQNITDDKFKLKKQLIRSLAFIKKNNKKQALKTLEILSQKKGAESDRAKQIISLINDPSQMEKANEKALLGTPYLYRTNSEHMFFLVFPKKADMTYLKTVISDFNTNEIGNEVFEVSALLLGAEKHILMIKSFESTEESLEYYYLFEQNLKLTKELQSFQYTKATISYENFKEFYKNNDLKGYYKFFKKNYLGEK